MIKLTTILLLLALVGCASAQPSTVKPAPTGLVQTSEDARANAVRIFKSSDTNNWVLHTTIANTATNITYAFSLDTNKWWVADAIDTNGLWVPSAYSNVVTNDPIRGVVLRIGK